MPPLDQNDRTMIERVDPLLGKVLDRTYHLEFRLATGGFGAIYRARRVDTGNEYAVKIVHARLASDPGVAARFRREGATLITLRSPHTISAYAIGETEGILYIVLELLRGVSLFEHFRAHGPIPWRRMVAIARGVCDSLAEAHGLGIVHRDLKPTNIHLERQGDTEDFVKVLDFGIAKILQHSPLDNADLTTAGLMIGTLDYMAPEQMLGGEISGATDLYTLGIVMYEMISGQRPFPEATSASTALAAALKPPPPLSGVANVPVGLERIVQRCLARDARERYRSAGELAVALDALVEASDSATGVRRLPSFDDEASTQIAARMPGFTGSGLTAIEVTAPNARAMPGITPTGTAAAPPAQPFPTIRTEVTPPPQHPPLAQQPFATIRSEAHQPYATVRTEITPPPQPAPLPQREPARPVSYRADAAQALPRREATIPPQQPLARPTPTRPPQQPYRTDDAPPPRPTPTRPPQPAYGMEPRRDPTPPPPHVAPARTGLTPPPQPYVGQPASPPLAEILAAPILPESPSNTLRGFAAVSSRSHTRSSDTVVDDPGNRGGYDVSGATRRNTAMTRIIWIVVLSIAALIGIGLAARM